LRIINGHDYYDSGLAYGHDPKVIFVRGETIVDPGSDGNEHNPQRKKEGLVLKYADIDVYLKSEEKQPRWRRSKYLKGKGGTWHFSTKQVIFCGKRYTGVQAHLDTDWRRPPRPDEYFWDKKSFDLFLDVLGAACTVDNRQTYWENEENVLFKVENVSPEEYQWLIDNQVSIAIQTWTNPNHQWKLNCTGLKEIQFYRVFDAVAAFQELDMWMSGALGMPGNPMVEISDADRLAKHGMDKWSFRKKVR
jgi:hypothetical protein